MKNAVSCDIKSSSYLIGNKLLLRYRAQLAFTGVTMKNAVFCDIKSSLYLTGNKLLLRYRAQPVNAM
jgi:hypothetical protein